MIMKHLQASALPCEADEIIAAVLATDRRVLLTGQAGIGKSTLVNALAVSLGHAGRVCWCLGADPGSPLFGVPGAVCLGRWDGTRWALDSLEALCSLDAGRFRLPLVSAVRRLAQKRAPGVLLLDGPGVVRGIAGAELLSGLVEAAAIEAVLVLSRAGRPPPLAQELRALPVEVFMVCAANAARRPGKRRRGEARTQQWQAYLDGAGETSLAMDQLQVVGTPPPLDRPAAWVGRQVALLHGEQTLVMGEVLALDDNHMRVQLPHEPASATTLLVRDAVRRDGGHLETARRFASERLEYLPPSEIVPPVPGGAAGGPRVAGRIGLVSVHLANGVFGDPLLHVRLRHERRSLLFDLGEGSRLPARVAHQVTDVFISHAHIDHIAGFLWLLRSRIGEFPACRVYGPPGMAGNIEGLVRGILWDRVADRGPCFEVAELHGERLLRFRVQAGRPGCELLEEQAAADGVLRVEPGFRVRAATLEHVSPVLAYAFEQAPQINIRKDRLTARQLSPGPWLGELKRQLRLETYDASIQLPNGEVETAGALAAELVLVSPGKTLVYATDFSDSPENRRRLVALAHNAHTLFCEATFLEADAEQAARTAHLTTLACGEIAEQAGVARLVPFHFSRRYEQDPESLYEEIAAACSRTVVPPDMTLFNHDCAAESTGA
jgi:ribonuclease BN (tRNA processing enzyme)/polynucleotide 5'-kinase involved in rRNA processing